MGMSRATFKAACWSALFAMLLAMMAPALLQSAHGGTAALYPEGSICSSAGALFTPLADRHAAPADPHSSFDHCPLCKVGADGAQLPAPEWNFLRTDLASQLPVALLRTAFSTSRWLAANPRGPPAV